MQSNFRPYLQVGAAVEHTAADNEHLLFYALEFAGTKDDATFEMLEDRLNAGMTAAQAVKSIVEGEPEWTRAM